MPKPSLKVLVVRLDGLGDSLISTPMLRALKTAIPSAEVTVLASPLGAQALDRNAWTDEIISFDAANAGIREKLRLLRRMRKMNFDTVLCISEKPLARWITCCSGAAMRIGFFPGKTQPFTSMHSMISLTHRIPSEHGKDRRHEVERHMALLSPLGIDLVPGGLVASVTDDDSQRARDYFSEHTGIPVVVHITSRWLSDGWTEKWVGAVLDKIARECSDVSFTVTSDAVDEGLAQRLSRQGFRSATGKHFEDWSALLANARALIAFDGGAVHLASALGTPVIDIIRSKDGPDFAGRWSPWGVEHQVVYRDPMADDSEENQVQCANEFAETLCYALSRLQVIPKDDSAHPAFDIDD